MHSSGDLPTAARALLFATAVVWLILELRQSTVHRAEGVTADRGSRRVIRMTAIIGAALAIATANLSATDVASRAAFAWIGLGFFEAGIALRWWSFRTLGRYFTFTVQTSRDQPVVTGGPYRYVRHPGYAGILLAMVGIGLFIGNWLSLISLVAVVTAGLVYRIRIEERALLQTLGDTYRSYAETHKRLVPFVW